MAHEKKPRAKIKRRNILLLVAVASILAILYFFSLLLAPQVEVIYFRNDGCELIHNTDNIINEAMQRFGSKIIIKIYNAQLHPTELNDTEMVKQLRERYNVVGLPEIIINGKKFSREFTRNNLLEEICNNFIVKPEECK